MNTKPYWCCGTCKRPLAPVGKKGVRQMMDDHRKLCAPRAGFLIKQVSPKELSWTGTFMDAALKCPECESAEVSVFYTMPGSYECRACKARLYNVNAATIPVLTKEESQQKRPLLYGLPECPDCHHAPHAVGCCRWCWDDRKPVVLRRISSAG